MAENERSLEFFLFSLHLSESGRQEEETCLRVIDERAMIYY